MSEKGQKMQEAIDAAFEGGKSWTEEEKEAYFNSSGDHPLLGGDDKDNQLQEMMATFAYDAENPAEKQAQECKDKGNAAYMKGPDYYANALKHYSDAIEHCEAAAKTPDMKVLHSICYSNRAAIYLARKQWDRVVVDAQAAVELNPKNVKAYFRAAKGCLETNDIDAGIGYASLGLKEDSSNQPLRTLLRDLNFKRDEIEAKKDKEAREKQLKEEKLAQARAAVAARDIAVGPPIFAQLKQTPAHPYVDEDENIHWPVAFLYDEFNQSDFIEDFPEVATFRQVLEMMFPAGERAPWDTEGNYTLDKLEIYYRNDLCAPLPVEKTFLEDEDAKKAARDAAKASADQPPSWTQVPMDVPLLVATVGNANVVCDFPTFHIVARDTEYYSRFMNTASGRITVLPMPERA